MTNVSKKGLSEKVERQLFSQFTDLFSSAERNQLAKLFAALFTEAERIMFIKRLAIVFLIAEEYSTYAIAKTLKVSDATVRAVRAQCQSGRFDHVLLAVKKKSFDKDKFWKTVDVLLRCGLPPRGKGRWRWLYENY